MILPDGRAKCELCEAFARNEAEGEEFRWLWFAGSLCRAYHYCAHHKASPEAKAKFHESTCKTCAKAAKEPK